jgi:hypothetical protein
MIGAHAGGLVHRMRVAALDQDVGFCAHDEECRVERELIETLEIDVAAVHDVEGASLDEDLVENIDVMHFAVRNTDLLINVGILPCRSSNVCILTAALCLRNLAHGNSARHKSMVVESSAYKLCARSTPMGSFA